MTLPSIPDAPNLPPWIKGYAHPDGTDRYAWLLETEALWDVCQCEKDEHDRPRWRVGAGSLQEWEETPHPNPACPVRAITSGGDVPLVLETDDYTEALAEFHKQAARLAEEG